MRAIYFMIVSGLTLTGCNRDEQGGPDRAPDGLNDALVQIPAGHVVSGFKHGRLRPELEVGAFSISKRPVTLEQFRTCIQAGACGGPASSCANSEGDGQDAALCVGFDNAEAYCAWSGGRLPRLGEWFLAARGHRPQRFSWGDAAPTCEQHPLARVPMLDRDPARILAPLASENDQTQCGEPHELALRVGRHEAGASQHGLEDVLLAKSELLMGHRTETFGACRSEDQGCLVYGLIPGAIDSVKRLVAVGAEELASSRGERPRSTVAGPGEYPYVFRCVWSQEDE